MSIKGGAQARFDQEVVTSVTGGALGSLDGRVFDAVIFDNDGTLIDSTGSVERSWSQWAMEHDVDLGDLHRLHGKPAAAIVRMLLPDEEVAAALARVDDLEVADVEGVAALPGALDALATLAGPPQRYAIATSATGPLADARLGAAGIDHPDVLVTVDDVEHGKPAPDPFLRAAEGLGVDPVRCLVVEDAVAGIAGARAAGCATLGVTTTTDVEHLTAARADAVVRNLAEVTFAVSDAGITIARR